jgi:predicted enzyme related to lactoylglutathione lyase
MNYTEIFVEAFVAIAAEPWEPIVAFYQGLLAVEPHLYLPDRYAEFKLDSLKLGIFKPNAAHTAEFQGTPGAISLCLEVQDLPGAIATIQTLGGSVNPEIMQTSHGEECYAYDPLQNRIILHLANLG